MNYDNLTVESIAQYCAEKSGFKINKADLESQIQHLINIEQAKQLTLTDVGNCPFEAYAVFCIECDRKGIKPIKHKDYLNLG